ncbi:GNAT family N-acetyltransferase [Paraflavitalea sp. CAU 1676]|uniref:GNAT family N-acetyltransferase n=1 Tax=Paraflavitalea sp. CAU 1676 TaxID=3032598 RepID=UPI0023DCBCE3|nr:GNAT family N-acetyltransferase [Paraflavitalea sp. CAU 1676]MDF2188910.1 GNAT family N-acetyltransferase [Paraflavitalea sp. CAU 1676]
MSTVTIRLADVSEAGLIADLSRQTFYDTFAEYNTPENMDKFMQEQFSREKLMAELYDPNSIFLLAWVDGEPAGYARLREASNPTELGDLASIEIARIYAHSKVIGRGVGSALMEHCIDVARRMNKALIWLGVWEHNGRAIAFYEKWGFTKFGEHIFALGDDPQTDWLMKKELLP